MKFHVFFFVCAALVAATTSIAIEDGIVCPKQQTDTSDVVQIPSPSNCGIFYKCERGRPIVNKCPQGLHYNKRLMVCDYPSHAQCVAVNPEQ
ncbi:PREDICTED: peritrophin-1-like [Bactrocera latifrons]|uniref:peritrophin-1-like n=1 Tax=Bactrocera latifrons TaxID=174628 RepID=UPI0008DDAFA6|nr:PREDICTED: peritrophin-1-like [Bactrocera latifrons]